MARKADFLSINEEALLWNESDAFVFGVDEAGRGCLAGPVCAAVSCWAPFSPLGDSPLVEVRDSKKMTEIMRERAFDPIHWFGFVHGVGFASAEEIDRWNIFRATHLAVLRAVEIALQKLHQKNIPLEPQRFTFLVDGNQPMVKLGTFFVQHEEFAKEFPITKTLMRNFQERPIVKGDSKVFSIACASVLAKVSRDRLMTTIDKQYPQYEFAKHKGYSTALHVSKIQEYGPCFEHRKTFAPVSENLQLFS